MTVRIDMIKFKLGAVLRQWQAEHDRDLSLSAISDAADGKLSQPWLSRFKHGQMKLIDVEKLGILCALLNCTPNDLLWEPNGEGDGSIMQPVNGAVV